MLAEINQTDLLRLKAMLAQIPDASKRVRVRSVNKAMTQTVTYAAKEITKDLNVTQTRVKKDFRINKANFSDSSADITASGKPLGLTSFSGTRKTAKGVSVKIKKSQPRVVLKHAFISQVNNASNAFWREYPGPRKTKRNFPYGILPRRYRLPIKRLTGPRIEDEYSKPAIINGVLVYGGARLIVVMEQELSFELSKL